MNALTFSGKNHGKASKNAQPGPDDDEEDDEDEGPELQPLQANHEGGYVTVQFGDFTVSLPGLPPKTDADFLTLEHSLALAEASIQRLIALRLDLARTHSNGDVR